MTRHDTSGIGNDWLVLPADDGEAIEVEMAQKRCRIIIKPVPKAMPMHRTAPHPALPEPEPEADTTEQWHSSDSGIDGPPPTPLPQPEPDSDTTTNWDSSGSGNDVPPPTQAGPPPNDTG
jgi:hypothetical protein